jgi:ferredoxin-type protein NapH
MINKNLIVANKWLILRRVSQLFILLLFFLGPWFGIWIVKGNIASSLTLDFLPLTDPFILLQSLFAGFITDYKAIIGVVIVVVFYVIVGGRVYCSWVCPVNMVTDLAYWLRVKLKITGTVPLDKSIRFWVIALVLILAPITGMIVWELVNPVTMLFRGLVFGMGFAWIFVVAVFLLDFAISQRAWCGKLCPVGAFYSLIGKLSLIGVDAKDRDKCDDCMDCYNVCPEPAILRPVLKKELKSTAIKDSVCTNCGRCIDVCDESVFKIGLRFKK